MYPTIEQVEAASHEQLARWVRFLPSPMGSDQEKAMDSICEKFGKVGGMTPELSKKIGW